MSLGQMPREVRMMVTGHKRSTSYEKYDLSSEVRMAAVQYILSQPFDGCGRLKAYPQVLEEKFSNFCQNIEGGGARGKKQDVGGHVDAVGGGGHVCVGPARGLSAGFAGGCTASSVDMSVDVGSSGCGSCASAGNIGSTGKGCSTGIVGSGGSKEVGVAGKGCSIGIAGSGGGHLKPSVPFVPYRIGEDIPFDESLLYELPPESARALGIGGRNPPVSVFPVCNMSNCVVNVYVGKKNMPFVPLEKK
ncbi:hypothetical protein GOP47_0027449 [Adiantum capillus-veneris]|nr:hypothetical protein GOP47_0027449 [Adiantum capillus-veneris]